MDATPRDVVGWIDEIETFPDKLHLEVSHLSKPQLDTPYREEGWTIRQVIHHIADSHLNGISRIKFALTEDCPTIQPYNQDRWAELSDYSMDINSSLQLISGLHQRWTHLLRSLDKKQLIREFIHPESGIQVLKNLIGHYAWHGKHHLGHITTLKKRKNWN